MFDTLTRKYMMTSSTQAEKGTLGLTVPNLVVNMNPSRAMVRNWAKVTRLPMPGSWLTSSSRKTTLEQQPTRTINMARKGFLSMMAL